MLKAVGLIKSSVSNDIKTEKAPFETSLASSFFKEVPTAEATPYSYSVSKLKELEEKLSTQKRSFTAAFYSDIDGEFEVPNKSDEPKMDDTQMDYHSSVDKTFESMHQFTFYCIKINFCYFPNY